MKTDVKNANEVAATAAKGNDTTNKTTNRPSLTGKEAKKDEKAADQTPAQTPPAESNPAAEVKAGSTPPVDNQPANIAPFTTGQEVDETQKPESAKTEEAVKEAVKFEPQKFALNLEQTLKSVTDLHRLSVQRLALIARIKTLEDFEVQLQEENDELESNPYQGCKLIIEDDKRRHFVTNTPNLIRMVSQFIFDACHEKLADIEANIVFPNA